MKKINLWKIGFFSCLLMASGLHAQNVAINNSGNAAYVSAILDLSNNNTAGTVGFLPPYVTLSALTTFGLSGTAAQSNGIIVYNTGGAVAAGLYYWNNTTGTWVSMGGGSSAVTAADDGTSLNGTTVILGGAFNSLAGELTQNTEIPMNGNNLTFSSGGAGAGKIGIALPVNTAAAQSLEIGGVANTIRVDGLGTAGTVYNQVTAATGNLVFANNTNGDLWSLPPPASASILTSSATGVLSWQTGTVPTGSGTLNYLARWTPNGTTLGTGITQDNGVEVGIQTGAYAFTAGNPLLQVTADASNINAILGTTAQTGGYGVEGSIVNSGASGGYGVEGLVSGSGGGFVYALYGASTVTAGNGIGVWGQATGGGAAINYGGYFTATGGASNYAIIVPNNGGFTGLYTTTPVNTLDVFGSTGTQISTASVTANTTLDATYSTILANPTGGAFTITLPSPGATNIRRIYTIVYNPSAATTNAVTVTTPSGSIYINGTAYTAASPFSFTGGSITIQSNGASWYATNDWTGSKITGSGTLNYLARWTPNGTTLGIGVTEDNGTSVAINNTATAPVNSQMLTVTGNATSVNAIIGTTGQTTGYGVEGINTSGGGTTAGVYGSSTSGAGYGVYGTNSLAGGTGVEGINTAADNLSVGYGVYGQTAQEGWYNSSAVFGLQEGIYYYNMGVQGLANFPYYNTYYDGPAYGAGVVGVGLAQGVWGASPNILGAGGAGVVGIGGGAVIFNSQLGYNYGVVGEMGTNGAAVMGFANGLATFPTAVSAAGTIGLASGPGSTVGAAGINQNANGVGVAGLGNNIAAFIIPGTGAGGAFTGNGIGSVGYAKTAASGVGTVGVGNNIAAATVPAAGSGGAFTGTTFGSLSFATTAGTGTGVVGLGNNLVAITTYANGSGGAFDGTSAGSFNYATTVASGTGVIGTGNATTTTVLAVGSGGAFNGVTYGLYAKSTGAGNPSGAIECTNTETGNTVYVDYYNGTNYKILGTTPGTVSCSVLDAKGNSVVMHAPETPEAYYEDYGQGKLVNGKIHIDLDPSYAKNICVNDKHPLRVFIQLEGDCKGVYVTNKTATGFDVVELDGGTSNTGFQYHIIGNQADAVMPSGVVSKFADLRFEPTPKPDSVITTEAKTSTTSLSTSVQEVNQPKQLPVAEAPAPGHTAKIPPALIQKYKESLLNNGGTQK